MVTSKQNRLPTISISKKGVYVLRIRFTQNRKQYEMTVPGQDETAWEKAEEVKISILLDVQRKLFDETLSRYRAISGTTPRKHEVVSTSQRVIEYVRLFELYLEEKRFLRPADSTDSEFTTYRMVRRWKINLYTDIRTNFLMMGYSNSTFTDRLIILKKWCDWMVDKKFLPENPVKIIKYKKRYPKKNPLREPLSDEILLQTLEALRLDQFKSSASYVHDSIYYAPLLFLLFTGCRPQEVVGLRVKYVDFANRVVMIREVLARRRSQTCSEGLIRKAPKTEAGKRDIPLDAVIIDVLQRLCIGKKPDDLVFLSPHGLAVDQRYMCKAWKKYLKALGHPEMDPYGFRHAYGTPWNEQGLNPVDGAEKMGHADVAVFFNTYSHPSRNKNP